MARSSGSTLVSFSLIAGVTSLAFFPPQSQAVSVSAYSKNRSNHYEICTRGGGATRAIATEGLGSTSKLTWQYNHERLEGSGFAVLALRYEQECQFLSSPASMTEVPSYQSIVRVGRPAVPLILDRLEESPWCWFPVLAEILGFNPIKQDSAGHVDRMISDWNKWATDEGVI